MAQADVQTTGTSTLSAEMKTYYEKRLIEMTEPRLIHKQFGTPYPLPRGSGKTIEWRKYSSLAKALTPLTEGVTPDGKALTVTTVTSTINQYGDYIRLSDLLIGTAIDNNIVQATKVLSSQAGRTLDTIIREELSGGTNVIYASKNASGTLTAVTSRSGLDATAALTPKEIFEAAAQLSAMNADGIEGGSFVAIVHPYVALDLMRNSEWIDVHKYQSAENIFKGEIGTLGNVRFVKNSEAKIFNDSTCPANGSSGKLAVFSTIVLGANAYAVTELEGGGLRHIVKQLGYGDDPLNQRSSVGWKATMACKRLVEEYMVRIESCSPTYSAKAAAN